MMSNLSSSKQQPHKRGREHDYDFLEPASKHHCSRLEVSPPALIPVQQEEPTLLTPPPTTASHNNSSPRQAQTLSRAEPKLRHQPSRAWSAPTSLGRALDTRNRDQPSIKSHRQIPVQSGHQTAGPQSANTWFIHNWLGKLPQSRVVQEEVENSGIIPTTEEPPDSEASRDQMSQQATESTRAPDSAASEKLKTSSPMYRAALKMNGVVIDNFGTKMPRDIKDLVTKHIRKARTSPPLAEDVQDSARRKIQEVWDSPELTVADIITAPVFDFANPALAVGRDILWSPMPLPRTPDYPLITPKTDYHVGFQTTLRSNWTRAELSVADSPSIRPYSQPSRENLFPSFLLEVKSEATGGTLYGAEGQLATAGFHRVRSLMWLLDQIDSARTRSSCDAIVFSAAICQREVVAHVHYYNPEDETFYMSYIDHFYFAKGVQGCHDHVKNVVDWLLEVQQPIVRDALRALHPMTHVWKKARSASSVRDAGGSSIGSDDGSSVKKQRLV
ncbi:hypothetical protein VM1G_02386 [Cytospora mali]|uniref:DUF7924 domain-containing protein n=1 Tax=Cytospora mali TaxID=578113 RepID=A0A194VP48_CYTMA|nr:hypothetical protein VM1G_02386 [Valsa mali]